MNTYESVRTENIACPLGCERSDRILLTGRDVIHGLPGEYTVVQCRQCGLIRTNPRPSPGTISFYYPDDYGPYQDADTRGAELKEGSLPLWKRVFRFLVRYNTACLPRIAPGRMLEIGCAAGNFMHRMRGEGWEVEGIEFSPVVAEKARSKGFSVQCLSLEQALPYRQPFDLVVGWMVVEHLHDPVFALKKLAEWTRPGGWLVVSVPNAGSLEARLFKDSWYALQLPTHLYHFSPRTIRKLLECGGWRVERVFHQRVLSNFIASVGLMLRKRGQLPLIANALVSYPDRAGRWDLTIFPFAYFFSFWGQTGRMTVWARKAND